MHKLPIFIGISGASGSGKSLFAHTIVREMSSEKISILSEDSYYKDHAHLPFEDRCNLNYDHPDAFDHALLIKQLHQLQNGETIDVPVYDHAQHRRVSETMQIVQPVIVIVEGIMLFVEPALRDLFEIRIFMDTPLDICLIRRLERDLLERQRSIGSVLTQYLQTVRPMYMQFIDPSKRHADLIVPHGGENRIAIDMIKAKIKELLTAY